MIDNSVIKRLAKECGADILADKVIVELDELQAFAQAVIENYKAGLVPVAYARNGHLFFEEQIADESLYIKLYELPSGETK